MYGFKPKKPKLIEGPGTGTSDSIKKEVPEGSYIMPTDSTKALGFRPGQSQQAEVNHKGFGFGPKSRVPVNVSNGELEIPPEVVQEVGAQVLDQLRDQTHDSIHAPGLGFKPAGMRESAPPPSGKGFGFKPGKPGQHNDQAGKGFGFKPRRGEEHPEQFFADGGLVQDERRQQQRRQMGERLSHDRQAIGNTAAMLGDAALGAATLRPVRRFVANTTFDNRLPGQDARDQRRRVEAGVWANKNPEQAEAGRQFGQGLSNQLRADGLRPRNGYPGINYALGFKSANARAAEAVANSAPATGSAGATTQPVLGQTGPASSAPNSAAEPAATNQWGDVGHGGIVGRRNTDGVMEFSNRPEDAQAGKGFGFKVGNGSGGLSVVSGGEEAMRRNQRATEIMRQTRLENSNPNYLTVVRDSGAPGLQGERNRQANERDSAQAADRRERHQQAVQQGQQRLDESDQARQQAQQVADAMAQDRQWATQDREWLAEDRQQSQADRQRLQALQDQMNDSSLPIPQRMEARRQYLALTMNPGDRYKAESVQFGTDADGKPILGNRLVDVATGEFVSGDMPNRQSLPVGMTADQAIADARQAIQKGASKDAVNERLASYGLSPI